MSEIANMCEHGYSHDGKAECGKCWRAKCAELEAENKALREMVVRMYHHCTVEKAEMTEAESDEWMTKAGALLESGYE